jgi:hypothetical protein
MKDRRDMKNRRAALVTTGAFALAAPVALAACGGDHAAVPDPSAAASAAPAQRSATARYLDRHALALALGNGFRAGLDRLAVMQQPPEGAADLGQELPAGLVRDVRCDPSAPRPAGGAQAWAWRCRVRWETVAGTPKSTNYDVRSLPTGCFAAGAAPRLADVRDPTIASFSEHPLNAVASARKGC